YGGNGNIIIPYNGISLTQAIVWYNSGGTGALLAMSSSASQINIPYGTTILTITVRVKNIGAYPLNNVTPSSVTISGNANTTITNNLCNGTLKIESSCSYQVDVTDTVIESNKQINLGISGTYNNGSSQLYSRILPIQYNSLSLWIWMSGESDINQYGVYGIKGIASPSNIPGGREGAISWTDSLGNLWLFGGRGYVGTQVAFFNDLWKYEISTNTWTWMSGESKINPFGDYGTKGVASSTNMPGSRDGSVSWTDESGNLWLFGGYGYSATQISFLNDLWKYDISTNTWTWMSGESQVNQFGNYGTKGVASSTNMPGSRNRSASWTDESGNFWLFGGYGYSANQISFLNDLWKYDIYTNTWTWVSGGNQINQFGNYGIKGVASSTNMPGSRDSLVSWKDGSGNLWIFGGYGYGATQIGFLNDGWKYDISTNTWTWMSGESQVNQFGDYGTKGIVSVTNMPGSRSNTISWKDSSGNLWIFGGYGYGATESGSLNDLWKYEISTNTWTWMNDENDINQFGTYNAKGIASDINMPGGRDRSVSWTDKFGNLWLFGGNGYDASQNGSLNDLWKYCYY
ncbi:MAG: kelch repeat-containing protein, partial [Neisseriaceae bacterium]